MLHPKRTWSRWKRFLLFLFLRGLFQQGLAGICTRAKHQWPRQPALPSCQSVSLRLWFPVALMVACTCSLNILHPLPRYLLIQKSLPPPLPLLPRTWGHSTSHHPAEKFSLHEDGTEDSSRICITREAKTLQLYIVSTHHVLLQAISQLRLHLNNKCLFLMHCPCCRITRWISALEHHWVLLHQPQKHTMGVGFPHCWRSISNLGIK